MNGAIERISLPLFNPLISPVSLCRGAISRCVSGGAENYLLNKFARWGFYQRQRLDPRFTDFLCSASQRNATATAVAFITHRRPRTPRAFLNDPTDPDPDR